MTLEETVEFMKAHKILALKLPDGTAVSLDPSAFEPAPAKIEPELIDGPDLDEQGSGGMTRRQQIELLGCVYESDFRKGKTR